MKKFDYKNLDFKKMDGLVPAIIQDIDTKAVLMLGFMNEDAVQKTLKDGKVTFWSRTRQKLWQKGETSGNYLEVVSISIDCDQDSLLVMAKPQGPTCHSGDYSCFGIEKGAGFGFLMDLFALIKNRKRKMPKSSYTTSLFKKGLDKILEKIGEESTETIIAAKNESRQRLIEEGSDLIYHLFVLLCEKNIDISEIVKELKRRNREK